ncbi:helix-turn-helix domain-containing protein [Rikenella microfusus]|uniref:helix-turn-helix domain-containing protein n=1 Tax=Rikenella microfusus TaxID=28139 RepID=UPI00248DFD1A|nr:helix-turn-helix domain-containing protein [Rikenella microfusus]
MNTSCEWPSPISKQTLEYKALAASLTAATEQLRQTETACRPGLCGERYYDGGEIMRKFHIGRTALQEYRLKGLIPYTRIGGVILYPHSGIEAVLRGNYCKPHKFG